MADSEPSVNGGPPATTGSNPKGGGNVLTKQAGPLPVYGWIVVAVAGVFLYRKLYGGSSGTAANTATTPTDSSGGVFIVPGTAGGGTSNPPTSVTQPNGSTVPTDVAISAIINQRQKDSQPLSIAGKSFLSELAHQPASKRQGEINFFAQNDARKSLGLPYFKGTNSKGIPVLYDPKTGYQTLLSNTTTKAGS